jgi:DNA-binding transcriptional ArsR family regulator
MADKVLPAFSNFTRLNLIKCLSKGGKNVTELISICGLSQSAVSQHLEKLKRSGVVKTKRQGKEIFYSLRYKKAAKLSDEIIKFAKEVERSES